MSGQRNLHFDVVVQLDEILEDRLRRLCAVGDDVAQVIVHRFLGNIERVQKRL